MKSKKQIISAEQIGAVAMMEKLARIWAPEGTPRKDIHASIGHSMYFQFYVDVGVETRFWYNERDNRWLLYSTAPFPSEEEEPGNKSYDYMGCLNFDDEQEGIYSVDSANYDSNPNWRSYHKRREFASKWLGFFRRNLWLCGCDIECTQHERMEWIQGWTDEEIEAWQLEL